MATGISKTQWNGNHDSVLFEAPPHTASDVRLSYEGKKAEEGILATPAAEVVELWSHGVDPRNELYFGDNLTVMAQLLRRYRRQVRLIYIDPPYSTKMVFQSRHQSDAYSDLLCGAHYLEFLRERLVLMRELLAEDGSIYVHLDENMAFHLKLVMDEVFGPENFRNWITRKKCNPKNYTRKAFGNISDFILFYTKSGAYAWNRPLEGWTKERAAKEYEYVDAATGRLFKKVPVHAPGVRNGATGGLWRGMLPPPGKHWQYTPEKLDEMDAKGEIYWSSNGNPRRKVFLDDSEGVPIQDIWLDCRDAHNQNIRVTGYPTEKNPDLVSRIIAASSNAGDIVLDAFLGSGTTAEAASQLGRRWIGIDNSPQAIATTLKRFSHGTKLMGDFVSERLRQERPQQSLGFAELKQDCGNAPAAKISDFALFSSLEVPDSLGDAIERWRSGKAL